MIKESTYIEPTFSIKDERFNIEKVPESELVIEISALFFRFAIKSKEQFVWLEDYIIDESVITFLEKIYDQNVFLSVRFWKSITVLVHSKKQTIVPCELNLDNSRLVWASLFEKPKNNSKVYRHIKNGQTLIYELNQELADFFFRVYQLKISSIIPAESVLPFTDNNEQYIIFNAPDFGLTFHESQLYSYPNLSESQLLQLLTLQNKSTFYAIAEATVYGKLFRSLNSKLPNLEMASLAKGISLSQYFQDITQHRYFFLFNA